MELLPNLSLCSPGLGLAAALPAQALHGLIIAQTHLQQQSQATPDVTSLTARMLKGEESAYQEFFSLYFNRLLRYLLVLTRNEDSAREALQLLFLRVARHVRQFDSESAFWTWLTVLARCALIDESRKSKRYLNFLQRLFQHKQTRIQPLPDDADARLLDLLQLNLPALDQADRALLLRKYCDGESVRQIATELGVSEKAIDSRLVRARQKLRERMLSQLKNES